MIRTSTAYIEKWEREHSEPPTRCFSGDESDQLIAYVEYLERENRRLSQGRAAMVELLGCLELAEKNNDLPLPLVGYGHIYIEHARAALAQN